MIEPPCTGRYARWCERSAVIDRLLLDYKLNSPQGSAMDGRAPCGFLLSFGEGGGIIGICRGDVGERTGASRIASREHHGERMLGEV